LPGIYSLAPYTPEEVVSRNLMIDEHPDLVINIVDAPTSNAICTSRRRCWKLTCP
ncbi:MAG: hypothetical protein K2I75_04870, partial [Clostridiales bacterium]|nr:hypothetical protein [Clostridiales bacterium]